MTDKTSDSGKMTTIAIASIMAVVTFLLALVFLADDDPANTMLNDDSIDHGETAADESMYPAGIPTVEGFMPSYPGAGRHLVFRDGRRVLLPEDVHHYDTMVECEGSCPPLPIYTLVRGEDTVSVDGNGEVVFLNIDTDNPEAFPFLFDREK